MDCIRKTLIIFLFCSAALSAQEIKYNLVDIGKAHESLSSTASSISKLGHITGNIELIQPFQWYDQAYIWENGTLDTLPKLSHPDFNVYRHTTGNGVNSFGHVVGNSNDGLWNRGFIFDGTTLKEIAPASGLAFNDRSEAFAINDSGLITGNSTFDDSGYYRAYIYDGNTMIDLGLIEGTIGNSIGYDINNFGNVVGHSNITGGQLHAFYYNGNTMLDLGVLDGSNLSIAYGINDTSWVVGSSEGVGAFLWNASTGMTALENLPDATNGKAYAINNSGTIVGKSASAAVIWDGSGVIDLNTVVDEPDWILEVANDINDAGQIVGTGKLNGETRAFLLNPVTETEGFVVNTTGDESDADLEDGICDTDLDEAGEQCSFRAAIEQSNFNDGVDVITFNITSAGIPKIIPKSALPEITTQIKIDATTQPGTGMVEIDGSDAGSAANGLRISANNCEVKGLIITNFAQDGIKITGNSNTIIGNIIGTNKNSAEGLGNGQNGISILNAANNTIGEPEIEKLNIIAGNDQNGILLSGSGASGNQIKSNYIGSDTSGTDNLGNGADGILIENDANNNIIGTDADLTQPANTSKTTGINLNIGNVIINNLSSIKIENSNSNTLQGNFLGLHKKPFSSIKKILGTRKYGLFLKNSPNNKMYKSIIGGTKLDGIRISGTLSKLNKMFKNIIGTDAVGTLGLGVGGNGVCIDSGAVDNQVGGIGEDSTMTIVAAKKYGIQLQNIKALPTNFFNKIFNAKIGILKNISSTKRGITLKIPNLLGGICLLNTQNTTIGKPSAFNTIAGNGGHGIILKGVFTKLNTITSNIIGTTADGEDNLGNEGDGICAMDSANNNTLGGLFSKLANTIAGNKFNGIGILGASNNKILSNKIGYMRLVNGQTLPLGNFGHGIFVDNGFQNVIRLSHIAANREDGIHISGALSQLNKIFGVTIGTDSSFTLGLGNLGNGISLINMLSQNNIGGKGNDSTVTIVSSKKYGIFTSGLLSGAFNKISNALIGITRNTNNKANPNNTKAILIKMPNILGGLCLENTQNMQVGSPVAPNTIAGNHGPGLIMKGSLTKLNKIFSNFFGTDSAGTENLGNLGANLKLFNGANNNWIGDEKEENGNTIVSSKSHGIFLLNTSGNKIFNNNIGLFKRASFPVKMMGNLNGLFANNASSTTIKKSIFSGNQKDGMRISGSGSRFLKLWANAFGTDFSGEGIYGNGENGLCVEAGANNYYHW
jgi:probable HAF family extracellular repeat protein